MKFLNRGPIEWLTWNHLSIRNLVPKNDLRRSPGRCSPRWGVKEGVQVTLLLGSGHPGCQGEEPYPNSYCLIAFCWLWSGRNGVCSRKHRRPNRIFGIVDNILLVLDGRTGEAIETVGTDSTPVGESVEAMTWHDVDGTLYAAVEVSGSSFDRLITINPITGQQTDIGGISLSDDAVDIAGLASEDGFCTALGGQMPTQ